MNAARRGRRDLAVRRRDRRRDGDNGPRRPGVDGGSAPGRAGEHDGKHGAGHGEHQRGHGEPERWDRLRVVGTGVAGAHRDVREPSAEGEQLCGRGGDEAGSGRDAPDGGGARPLGERQTGEAISGVGTGGRDGGAEGGGHGDVSFGVGAPTAPSPRHRTAHPQIDTSGTISSRPASPVELCQPANALRSISPLCAIASTAAGIATGNE